MRRIKSALMAAAITAVLLVVSAIPALACTGVYVGKDVSTDGSVIIARSEDQGQGVVNKRFKVVERVENVSGRYLEVYGAGTTFPLPATTYKYTMMQDFEGAYGDYAGGCVNENGVAVTATVTASTKWDIWKLDPPTGDVEEAMIANYVAAVATSARDGVVKLGALIAARGSNEANVMMIVDQSEAWYMEMYTGHHWVAVKMPTDRVAVFGNCFMLGTDYDPDDPNSFLCSAGLFDFVTATNLGVYEDVGGVQKLNLVKTFGNGLSTGNQTRNWGGHHFLAPSTAGEYDANKYYDLFYAPDEDVSPMGVLDLMRYRLEDTALYGQRAIATDMSSEVHALQVFSDMPAECDTLQWICLGNAEHSVFVPSWSGITDVHATYKAAQTNDFDTDGAYFKFKQICSLAAQNRDRYSQGVRNVWKLYERMFYDDLMTGKASLKATYADSGRAAGDQYVTQLGNSMADVVFNQADKLYEDLLYYAMWNTGRTPKSSFEATLNLTALNMFADYEVDWDKGFGTATFSQRGNLIYTFEVDPTNIKSDYNAGNAISTLTDEANGYYYSVPLDQDLYAAYSLVAKQKNLISFSINGCIGVIDQAKLTVNVTMPHGTVLTSLVPVVEFTGKSVSPASGAAQDFSNPVVYTLTDESGATKNYTVTVKRQSSNSSDSIPVAETFTVTTSAGEGGAISGSLANVTSGQDVNIEIKPGSMYKIKDVTVDGKSVTADLSFSGLKATCTLKSVTADHTVAATFEYHKCLAYTDITGHWAEPYICYAAEKDLLTGTSATAFSPELSMNRAMIVTALWRLEGKPASIATVVFDDVKTGNYFNQAVAWAAEKGIVTGRSASRFDPYANVTRQEIAVFLYRYAGFKGADLTKTGALTSFADKTDVAGWADSAVAWAVGEGILTGRGSDTVLAPAGVARRSEFAAMLYRFLN